MEKFQKFLVTPIGSACRVALGVILGYFVLDLSKDGTVSVDLDEFWSWVAAALVVAVPIVIAAVNPADTRYGRGSGSDEG